MVSWYTLRHRASLRAGETDLEYLPHSGPSIFCHEFPSLAMLNTDVNGIFSAVQPPSIFKWTLGAIVLPLLLHEIYSSFCEDFREHSLSNVTASVVEFHGKDVEFIKRTLHLFSTQDANFRRRPESCGHVDCLEFTN